MRRSLVFALLLLPLAACGVISPALRDEAVPLESFAELRARPEAYRGEVVILGGEIIETRNRAQGTELLILQKPLDRGERPRAGDVSGGRFMVRFGEYLDPVLFAPGRRVTVAGMVAGTETGTVGEAPYTYVVLDGRELHLWPRREHYDAAYGGPPWPPYYYYDFWHPVGDPWYPYWYDPYWGRRPWWR